MAVIRRGVNPTAANDLSPTTQGRTPQALRQAADMDGLWRVSHHGGGDPRRLQTGGEPAAHAGPGGEERPGVRHLLQLADDHLHDHAAEHVPARLDLFRAGRGGHRREGE